MTIEAGTRGRMVCAICMMPGPKWKLTTMPCLIATCDMHTLVYNPNANFLKDVIKIQKKGIANTYTGRTKGVHIAFESQL